MKSWDADPNYENFLIITPVKGIRNPIIPFLNADSDQYAVLPLRQRYIVTLIFQNQNIIENNTGLQNFGKKNADV